MIKNQCSDKEEKEDQGVDDGQESRKAKQEVSTTDIVVRERRLQFVLNRLSICVLYPRGL